MALTGLAHVWSFAPTISVAVISAVFMALPTYTAQYTDTLHTIHTITKIMSDCQQTYTTLTKALITSHLQNQSTSIHLLSHLCYHHLSSKSTHITPILKSLHWLKMNECTDCKFFSLTYEVLTAMQPSYLYNLSSLESLTVPAPHLLLPFLSHQPSPH